MEIHNTSEDIIFSSVQTIFSSIEKEGNPERFCLCEQCRMDTICYTLNRVEPHYIVSNRGFTRMEMDGIRRQQIDADVVSLVYRGLRLVTHNQRPTALHDGSMEGGDNIPRPAFEIPTIAGRVFDGITFEPLSNASVELRYGGGLVPMKNRNWQNPYVLVPNTPGAFSFWPAQPPADAVAVNKLFEYSLRIEAPNYEPVNHFFNIQSVSILTLPSSRSIDRTFKLPDIYMFPPGEAEQNG